MRWMSWWLLALVMGCQTGGPSFLDGVVGEDGEITHFVLVQHRAPEFFDEGYLADQDRLRVKQLQWQVETPYLLLVRCSAAEAVTVAKPELFYIEHGPHLVTGDGERLDCELADELLDAYSAFHFLNKQQMPEISADGGLFFLALRGGFERKAPGNGIYESALYRLALAEMLHASKFPGGKQRKLETQRLQAEFAELDGKLNPCLSAFPLDHYSCVTPTRQQRGIFRFDDKGAECSDRCVYHPQGDLGVPILFEELDRLVKAARKLGRAQAAVNSNGDFAGLQKNLLNTEVNWVEMSSAADEFLRAK